MNIIKWIKRIFKKHSSKLEWKDTHNIQLDNTVVFGL